VTSRYPDTGCPDLGEPSCLSCTLPKCRYDYDEPLIVRAMVMAARSADVVRAQQDGLAIAEIAERFDVSKRTVQRILAGA